MVIKAPVRTKENLYGPNGVVEFHDILVDDELLGHANLYSHVIFPPKSGIGWHVHTDTTEPYYVIKGYGIFTEPDGTEVPVGPGDVCKIPVGEGHAIRNISDTETLEMIALILKDKAE